MQSQHVSDSCLMPPLEAFLRAVEASVGLPTSLDGVLIGLP